MSGFTYLTEVGLVDRLRAAPSKRPAINEFCFLVEEAADEIGRLRQELAKEMDDLSEANKTIERLTAELAHMQTMQKVDQRVFEKLRETQDLAEHWAILAEQRRVELGECRKEASAEAADEIERLQRMIDHYEQALKAAFPQGATGMAFEHWNEARKLK